MKSALAKVWPLIVVRAYCGPRPRMLIVEPRPLMFDIWTPAIRWIASVMFWAGNLPISSDEMPSVMRMSLRLAARAEAMLWR